MNKNQFQELLTCSRNPWYFLTNYVKTQDPKLGIAAYPDYDYLRELAWLTLTQRYLLVPKSRQMLVTWSMVSLFVWRALFKQPGDYLFLSRNERCAEELLDSARFIISQLPEFMQPQLTTNNKSEIEFGGLHTRLLSLPAAPDGPRMYSPTAVFWDEMAFTPFDDQIWTALQPSISSGGSFAGVSTSNGALNLFAKLVTPNQHSKASAPAQEVLNKHFHIHKLHFSRHPDRDNEKWKQEASRGLSQSQWNREQEMSFESVADRVYSEFQPTVHILKEEFHPRKEWPLFRTIDFGYRKPFVLWLQQIPSGEYIVFSEWDGRDCTTEAMHATILRTDLLFGLNESDYNWTAADPSGAAAQDSGISPVDYLVRNGMKIRHRTSKILSGVELVKAALRDANGKISLFISPRCQKLMTDLENYRWDSAKEEPVKDGVHDHSLDALRYFFVNLEATEERAPATPRVVSLR
ncbi:MAG: hypothetical protein IPP40_13270 [bacterium]|nr:hypothetical protein [bacterium]